MIYNYHHVTKEYIGNSEIEYDPIDNEPMIPANATVIEPPKTGLNECAIFNGAEWDIVPDYRGTIYYKTWNDSGTTITKLGETLPEEAFLTPPDKPLSAIEEEIRIHRDSLLRKTVDTINPIRWETLSEIQRQEYRDYRQALLDVPQQSGFPNDVIWPKKPNL